MSYVQIKMSLTDVNTWVYLDSFSAPTGITAIYKCDASNYGCWYDGSKYYNWVSETQTGTIAMTIGLALSATQAAPLGDQTITLTLQNAQLGTLSLTFTVTVADPPAVPSAQYSLPRGAIPPAALATWRNGMTTKGTEYCTLSLPVPYGTETHIWYYDGGFNYQRMRAFTGDSATWAPCANWLIDAYRDHVNVDGEGQGWHVFPHGLVAKYLETGQQTYKDAVYKLATATPFLDLEAGTFRIDHDADCWGGADRETAYVIDALLAAEKVGYARTDFIDAPEGRPKLYVAVDRTIHYLDNFFRPRDKRGEFQSWQAGLAARSLIDYYGWTKNDVGGPDTRVLRIVKDLLDWVWENRQVSTNFPLNNPSSDADPQPNLCCSSSGGCATTYWGINAAFLAPAYAWYWRTTGDATALARGDALFVALTNVPIETQKQWSQIYRWTFEYYRWRTEGLRGAQNRGHGLIRGKVKAK